MSHFVQTNNVIIQPPAYLQGNKTSLLTYGTNDFEIGKNSSSSLIFTDDEIKSNKPLKHVKLDGSIIDYLTTNNLADLESEDADELSALPGSILSAGDSLLKQQSPFPFALMDGIFGRWRRQHPRRPMPAHSRRDPLGLATGRTHNGDLAWIFGRRRR
jgi:hypothetical protein